LKPLASEATILAAEWFGMRMNVAGTRAKRHSLATRPQSGIGRTSRSGALRPRSSISLMQDFNFVGKRPQPTDRQAGNFYWMRPKNQWTFLSRQPDHRQISEDI
jgi:hypothetical protein